MAKKYMYVCLGVLALAVAYHLGAKSAISQGTGIPVGISSGHQYDDGVYVITDQGDVYRRAYDEGPDWVYWGNPLNGMATQPATWGRIKAEFGESAITE